MSENETKEPEQEAALDAIERIIAARAQIEADLLRTWSRRMQETKEQARIAKWTGAQALDVVARAMAKNAAELENMDTRAAAQAFMRGSVKE